MFGPQLYYRQIVVKYVISVRVCSNLIIFYWDLADAKFLCPSAKNWRSRMFHFHHLYTYKVWTCFHLSKSWILWCRVFTCLFIRSISCFSYPRNYSFSLTKRFFVIDDETIKNKIHSVLEQQFSSSANETLSQLFQVYFQQLESLFCFEIIYSIQK